MQHRGSSLGGLSWYVYGDNGNMYYGTHLQGYENQGVGWVEAGTVIGYVGSSGNVSERAAPALRDPPRRWRRREPLPGHRRRLLRLSLAGRADGSSSWRSTAAATPSATSTTPAAGGKARR